MTSARRIKFWKKNKNCVKQFVTQFWPKMLVPQISQSHKMKWNRQRGNRMRIQNLDLRGRWPHTFFNSEKVEKTERFFWFVVNRHRSRKCPTDISYCILYFIGWVRNTYRLVARRHVCPDTVLAVIVIVSQNDRLPWYHFLYVVTSARYCKQDDDWPLSTKPYAR